MGKTGTTQWVQIKGAMFPARRPGGSSRSLPNQRFKTGINLKLMRR